MSWAGKINSRAFVVRDQFDAMVTAIYNEPGILHDTPRMGTSVSANSTAPFSPHPINSHSTQMFHFFFAHLRTTITWITVILNEYEICNRDANIDLKIVDELMKEIHKIREAEATQAAAEARAAKGTSRASRARSKGKQRATTNDPDDSAELQELPENPELPAATSRGHGKGKKNAGNLDKDQEHQEAMKFTRSFLLKYTTLDKFYDCFIFAQKQMATLPFTRKQRIGPDEHLRILATCGLRWNVKSTYRLRDFTQVALCVVLEDCILHEYRPMLMANCPGFALMRDEIQTFFIDRTEDITVDDLDSDFHCDEHGNLDDPSEMIWSFADDIDSDSSSLPPFTDTNYLAIDMEESLDKSIAIAALKNDDQFEKQIFSMVESPYLACSEDGVESGTLESSAYFLLNALFKVSRLSRILVPALNMRYRINRSGP